MEKKYKNLWYFMLLFIPLTFLGFYKSYFVQFPHFTGSNNYLIHIHATLAGLWVLMLIVQPFLVVNKKLAWHRAIGKASYFILPLLILSFIPQILRRISEGNSVFTFFPISDALALLILYSLAIYYRKKVGKHMRYMIASSLVFLGPTFGRIGLHVLGLSEIQTQHCQYGIIYLILGALIFLDKSNSKDYRPYLVAVALFVIHQISFMIVFH